MNLFKVVAKTAFINETANYVISNFGSDLSRLKIILPTGYLCSYLQEFLTLKLGTAILPSIIPISELTTETEESFKIPSNETEAISKLQARIILAEIVHSYTKLGYNSIQSLRLSSQLANLFHELEINEINIEKLKDTPTINQSLHWHSIYEFLVFSNKNWQIKLKELGKLSRAGYQKVMFKAEIARIKANVGESILIAGVATNDIQTQEFIRQVTELPNGHLILPPTGDADPVAQSSPEQALFNIHKLILATGQKPANFKTLGPSGPTILDKLIEGGGSDKLDNIINYLEFDNIFDESAYIASLIENLVSQNNNTKIALIINNTETKEIYTNFLEKYGINYHDLIGTPFLQINHISFLICVAELLCTDFSLKKLFNLLGSPLISQPLTIKLKNLIIKENRFATSFAEVQQVVDDFGDQELKDWVDCFLSSLQDLSGVVAWNRHCEGAIATAAVSGQGILKNHEIAAALKGPRNDDFLSPCNTLKSGNTFNKILLHVVQAAEKLCPAIWQTSAKYHLSDAISEIIAQDWEFKLENIEEFPDILIGIIGAGRVFPQIADARSNIILCRASDAALINFDHVIIADFSEGNYPAVAKNSPWMNRHMQEELGLYSEPARYGNSLYEFYLLLNNPDVIITRSKKQTSGKLFSRSHFLLRLETILGNRLNKSIGKIEEPIIMPITNKKFVIADSFPKQISATDIEMLIRSPYNFYAKKILKLRSINTVEDSPSLAEFGNFFHKVVETYTKNYNKGEQDKPLVFAQTGEFILSQSALPPSSRKHWQTKLVALAEDFIFFDEERRKGLSSVHSELRGTLTLSIRGHEIEIIAIADRIEISKSGRATILDYKTGAIPTKKDVLSGLSPQLIIEALIMMENGFGLGKLETDLLVYVKIGSTKPYINTTEISLTKSDLLEHKEGLIALLEHYITEKKFQIEPNLMKYDDYRHLSRR
jgi:ATP-dependent helicase/nuclease subunit B